MKGLLMKSIIKFITVFNIVFSIVVTPFKIAYSQGIGFSISPENPEIAFFDFTLKPGESVQDAINAKNFSSDRINMMVEVVEAQTALNGGLSFDFEKKSGASQWVTINSEKQFELRGSNVKRLPFSVTVPAGTAPGEYTVGFLAALVPTTPTPIPNNGTATSGYAVDVITRVAVTIVIHVPGTDNCKLVYTNIEASVFNAEWRFTTQVQNTGNIHFAGTSSLNVYKKLNHQKIAEAAQKIGYFATNSELLAYNKLPIPEPGEYTFDYTLTDTKNPICSFTYQGETNYGEAEQNLLATQATIVSIYTKPTMTSEPQTTKSPDIIQQVQTKGSLAWYVWFSGVLFFLSLGLVIYALSVLKKNKK
jgi:hypothetical protein